ncbi:MAG: hypothetical protein ACK4S2_01420 [Gemmobacter sp.]
MLGLLAGRPGARAWRRMLPEPASQGGLEVLDPARNQVMQDTA